MKDVSLALLLALPMVCAAQHRPMNGVDLPWPPATGTARVSYMLPPGYEPQSLKALCDSSTVIVDGVVESVLPSRIARKQSLDTDAIIAVSNVFKGPSSLRRLVVSQRGGVIGGFTEQPIQYALMHVSDHCILFLYDDKRPNLPIVAGAPRYEITNIWTGIFRVDGSTIHLSEGSTQKLRSKYEGLTQGDLVKELAASVKP